MRLSLSQLEEFHRSGFLLVRGVFHDEDIARIKAELPAMMQRDSASRVMENDGRLVRSVYGGHRTNEICAQLVRHPRLLGPAMQILDSRVYVHQFKINAKAAFGGDRWEWHQDYIFWRNEDGMPSARVVNVAMYLDDVTEFNGPMLVLPGSHTEGVVEIDGSENGRDRDTGQVDGRTSPAWLSHLTAGLKYAIDVETIKRMVMRWGIQAPKAPAGAVLFFDANIVHGSSPNMSPFDRAMVIVTFNSVENTLPPSNTPRPEFLASRDFSPLDPVADDVWTAVAAVGSGAAGA